MMLVDILDLSLDSISVGFLLLRYFPSGFEGLERGFSSVFFTPIFLMKTAASPPVEVTLPAIRAAVLMQTGHMRFLLW
jgi:hypothetical protein